MNSPQKVVQMMKFASASVLAAIAVAGMTAMPAAADTVAPTTDATATSNMSLKDPRITAAMLDLAKRQNVPVSEVRVVSANEGMWSSGAAGCPQPDRMYTMALVPGSKLVLAIGSTEFVYPNFGYCATPGGAFYPGMLKPVVIPA